MLYNHILKCPPQNLPFSFFSLQARCPAFLILTLWLGSCGIFCEAELVTSLVAKGRTLVRAAETPPDSALRGHCNVNLAGKTCGCGGEAIRQNSRFGGA